MTVGGWQWTQYIHMVMSESGIWTSERPHWSIRVACDFRSLAVETGFGPVADIHVHFGQHERGANELQSGPNTGMGEPGDGVENSSAHVTFNKGFYFVCGYITEYHSVTGWQSRSFDLETCRL